MATPSYPLATLACTVSSTGISQPIFADIIGSLLASATGIFGSDVYLPDDSQDYELIALVALAINDGNNADVATIMSFSPSSAQGVALSGVVKINGIERDDPDQSTAVVTLVGQAGTLIVGGVCKDQNGNLWDILDEITIPPTGTIDVTVTAEQEGAINAAENTINIISTQVLGWQTCNNALPAIPGAPVEQDGALRTRQTQSTAISAKTPIGTISAAVAAVAGVSASAVYENKTDVTDSNGIPSHSISAVVAGGDVVAVATAIAQTKAPGTGTYGTTAETVPDPQGLPSTINFFELDEIPIFVNITITALAGYVGTTAALIQQMVAAYISALPIGGKVYQNRLYGPATLNGNALQTTYDMTGIQIGTISGELSTADIVIAFNAGAVCSVANVTVVVS